MIAGETEAILSGAYREPYDYFLFFGKKKNKKKRDGRFWKNLGKKYDEAGGITGIGQTVDNIIGLFRRNDGNNQPADIQFSMQEPTQQQQNEKAIPMAVYVVGGLLVLGVIGFGYSQLKKNQKLNINSQE